jgi:PAS domain S-box-containing protein
MNRVNKTEAYPIRIKPYTLALMLIWSAVVTGSLVLEVSQVRQGTLDVARIQARDSFMKDVIYRRWNAKHGGVYVPATDKTPPNPYLNVPERDIITPSGIELTMMNPAYMTRQVHEIAAKTHGVLGHITSLNPIRPANAPDPWETQALEAFKGGAKEFSSVEEVNGEEYMRLMQPLVTEKGCLKCHATQGYKAGDIRGGIGVSVPISPLWAVESSNMLSLLLGHGLLLMVGLVGIGIGARRLSKQITKRKQAEEALQESEARFRSLSDAAFEGIVIAENGRIIEVNSTMSTIFGYSTSELISMSTIDLVAPEMREKVQGIIMFGYEKLYESKCLRKDSSIFPVEVQAKMFTHKGRNVRVTAVRDITERKQAEEEIKKLRGILPLCSYCKKVRDDDGYWEQVDVYIHKYSEADVSHSICPECMKKHYPEEYESLYPGEEL